MPHAGSENENGPWTWWGIITLYRRSRYCEVVIVLYTRRGKAFSQRLRCGRNAVVPNVPALYRPQYQIWLPAIGYWAIQRTELPQLWT